MSSPTARCSSPRSKCGSPSIMNSQSCQFSSILLPRRHKISAQQVDQGSSTRTRNSSEPLYSWAAQWQPSCCASETRHPQRADKVLTGPRRASVGSSAPTLSERSGRRDRSTPCPFRAHSRRSQRGFKQQATDPCSVPSAGEHRSGGTKPRPENLSPPRMPVSAADSRSFEQVTVYTLAQSHYATFGTASWPQ